ncbi:MAG: hypothetical protein LBN95_11510, partial [Prevotellaceae bacterium]|jgi:hypothetical protein|nr:hypothetical protein [Prevotellaceae bacterium]
VADVTLSETTVPYYIGNISCTGKFTINAGVTIYRAADSYFTAADGSAQLLIKGTAEKPVLITRLPNTSEYWNEVRIYGTAENSIEYCTFEYGGKGQYESLLYLTGSQETELTLKNCIFRNSYNYGIEIAYWDRGYLRLTHENVTFANNTKGNVYDWSADHIYDSLNDLP